MASPCAKKGRPNLVENELLTKLRDIVIEGRMAGGEISRRRVIAIDTGVVKANCLSKLKEYDQDCIEWQMARLLKLSPSSNFYSRKNLHLKESSRQLLKSMTYQRSLYSI